MKSQLAFLMTTLLFLSLLGHGFADTAAVSVSGIQLGMTIEEADRILRERGYQASGAKEGWTSYLPQELNIHNLTGPQIKFDTNSTVSAIRSEYPVEIAIGSRLVTNYDEAVSGFGLPKSELRDPNGETHAWFDEGVELVFGSPDRGILKATLVR